MAGHPWLHLQRRTYRRRGGDRHLRFASPACADVPGRARGRLALGVLIGRIGDVINGEHYGPPTDSLLGVRNTHPDASVPSPEIAYHSGGLYEALLAGVVLAIMWPLRARLRTPTAMVWLVLALFSAGRFVEFFLRSDSPTGPLALSTAQWTSVAIFVFAIAAAGRLRSHRSSRWPGGSGPASPK